MANISLTPTAQSGNWALYTITSAIMNDTDLFAITLDNASTYDYRIELNSLVGEGINFNTWAQFNAGQTPAWEQTGGKNSPAGIFQGIITNQSGIGFTFTPPVPVTQPFSMTIQITKYL
jgi:hypothetical protein